MAESTTALITNAAYLGALPTDTVANLMSGAGQVGLGVNLPLIDAVTPQVMMPIYPVVLHAPTMFIPYPNMIPTLKGLIETHARTITGIDFQQTLDAQPTPIGHDGQQLNMPTDAKRSQVSPSFEMQELTGNLVINFFKTWMYMIKYPDTQASILSALESGTLSPQLLSYFTMDVIFLQFDQTMRPELLIDAFIVSAMWPNETGMFGFERQVSQSKVLDRTIQFHGVLQHNKNTKQLGVYVAQALAMHTVNYQFAAPSTPGIESNLQGLGLEAAVAADTSAFTPVQND